MMFLMLFLACQSSAFHFRSFGGIYTTKHKLSMLQDFSAKTESIFYQMEVQQQPLLTGASGAGGSPSLEGLRNLDKAWMKLKDGGWKDKPFEVVYDQSSISAPAINKDNVIGEFDVVVSGGTLGIFYAAALQKIGYKTAVVERGKVAGRAQEWNISRKELQALVRLEILTNEDIEAIISIEFNPVRVGFKTDTSADTKNPGFEVYVNDILNLGVKPDRLIELMKQKYESLGGVIMEGVGLSRVDVYSDIAHLKLSSEVRISRMRNNLLKHWITWPNHRTFIISKAFLFNNPLMLSSIAAIIVYLENPYGPVDA
jgi:hypothetical protein